MSFPSNHSTTHQIIPQSITKTPLSMELAPVVRPQHPPSSYHPLELLPQQGSSNWLLAFSLSKGREGREIPTAQKGFTQELIQPQTSSAFLKIVRLFPTADNVHGKCDPSLPHLPPLTTSLRLSTWGGPLLAELKEKGICIVSIRVLGM